MLGAGWAMTVLGGQLLTLDDAVALALTNSPDARVAQQRVAAAQAGLQQANAAFFPLLQFNSGYVRTDNPMQVFGVALNQRAFSPSLNFNDVPDADNLNVHGSLVVPLYAGGQHRAGRRSAQAESEAASEMVEAVRHGLAFEVARAFYTVAKTHEFIRATRAGVEAFESNLAVITRRFQAGTALRHEMLDVEVRLAMAREELARAINAHALARHALRTVLGEEQGEFETAPAPAGLEVPQARDLLARPELKAAALRVTRAEAELQRARGGQLPRLNAVGRYDYDHGWKFDGSGDSYTVGVLLQWDVWNGNLTRARVKEAQANLETAREQERKLRLVLDLELQEAHLRLREAEERLQVSAQTITQATESAELTRARFQQGLALATQLIDAETVLTAARVRRSEAEADREIAVAALRKALGIPPTPGSLPAP
jgi:outer membrane protein TolC